MDDNIQHNIGEINPLDKEINGKDTTAGDLEKLYSEEDKVYLSFLQKRLESARNQKNQRYPEYNNKTYWEEYEANEKISNTMLPEKKNDDDVIVSAGTVESKLDAILSNINNLNLSAEIHTFDRENNRIVEISEALEDIDFITAETDGGDDGGDEVKKQLRQRTLLKQGTVLVQEEWLRTFETKKKLTKKYNGEFKDWKKWTSNLELVFEGPSRTLIYGPNFYPGNVTEFFMSKQPYFSVLIHQDYEIARTKYGHFENWKYVNKGRLANDVSNEQKTIYDNQWRLTELQKNQVEIIIYQDQPNDEFQIIINGVMMLPIGFPLSAVTPGGKYNVAKQVFRVINEKFFWGKSFVSSGSIQELSKLIDEMLKLFVLKTRKSFQPSYGNISGRVISPRVLSPGRITMGLTSDVLQKIGEEGQGVTASEFSVLKELQDRIDKSTISPQAMGQQGARQATATEVLELQRQAKLTLGLTISACTMLEKKLGYLRLWNNLKNWMNPSGTKIMDINGVRKKFNKFRGTNRETNIEGEGLGERQVILSDKGLPSPEVIREMEKSEEEARGVPIRKIFLNPNGLRAAKFTFFIIVTAKEKESNMFFKLLFREQLNDMLSLMQLGSVPNLDGLEDQYAKNWNTNRRKLFSSRDNVQPGAEGKSPEAIKGRANSTGTPSLDNVKSEGGGAE